MIEKVYTADRKKLPNQVIVMTPRGQYPLKLRTDLVNHSPTGFEWGYGGSGPSQLALAILADLYDDETAVRYHQDFKREVVCGLDRNRWSLTDAQVRVVMDLIKLSWEERVDAIG
jgi:hypothetical protein